jgi:hypothetical protein
MIVIAGLDPAIHHFRKKMDARVTSAFTRVFDALCPRMTQSERFSSTGIRSSRWNPAL